MDQNENKPEGWYVQWAGFWTDGKTSRSEGPMSLLEAQSYAALIYDSDCSVPVVKAYYNSKESPVYKEFVETSSSWVRNPQAIRKDIAQAERRKVQLDRDIEKLNEELKSVELQFLILLR